jgi:two-component system, NtrC family, sensor kinase
MPNPRILLIADTSESTTVLNALYSEAGFSVAVAEEAVTPLPADIVVVDVTRVMFSPFSGLQAQRRMGCTAPALILAPRLNDQMAGEIFALDIRDFVLKPVEDSTLIERTTRFASATQHTRDQGEMSQNLAQAESALTRRLEEMSMLSRIGRAIVAQSDLDTMLTQIVDAAVFLTHAQEGAIFLLDESGGGLALRAEKGFGAKQSEIISRPSDDSDAMDVLRSGQPVMKSAEAEHKVKTGFLVRALINVPIIIGRNVGGVLAVYNHGDHSFDTIHQALLVNLADYAAMAIDKVRALQQAHQQAQAQIGDSIGSSRDVVLHAKTLIPPIEGIESLVETLLNGNFGPLNEKQTDAVRRIKTASVRMNEVLAFINEAAAGVNMQAGSK